MEDNGFQPVNTVGGEGIAWEGRLLCFAPVSHICVQNLHFVRLPVMPVVPEVEINSVSWYFKSRTMRRAASTVERYYSAQPSICFYYKSHHFNSFSENSMPLESGDCKKISNVLSKFTTEFGNFSKGRVGASLHNRVKDWKNVKEHHITKLITPQSYFLQRLLHLFDYAAQVY